MAENVLLVPIGVEALVVNQADKQSTTWSIGHKNYTGLSKFEPLEPPPFVRGNDWPRLGVTLHWALPDGLTRGEEKEGKLVFPYIPNRWLIVRSAIQPALGMKAWIVESDYLGPDGSNLYPDPDSKTKGPTATKLGRSFEIEKWPGETKATRPHLTALGAGDVTFAAYIANIDNVLSFYDSLNDLELFDRARGRDDPATLSYLVVGWYAQPEADPLAFGGVDGWQTAAEWTEKMARLKWSLGDEADLAQGVKDMTGAVTGDPQKDYPARTLCHGLISGINWTGRYRGAAQTGPLSRKNRATTRRPGKDQKPQRAELPQIAIGNSAIDALAALLEYLLEKENEPVDISTLIQALEYDLVYSYDEPGGQIELDQQIHQQWFTSSPGGKSWQVVAAQKEGATDNDSLAEADAPLQLSGEQAKLLDDLNKAQGELDQAECQLRSRRWELYALWWKNKRLPHLSDQKVGIDLEALDDHLNKLKSTVAAKQMDVDGLRDRCDRLKIELNDSLSAGADHNIEIKQNSAPRFYRPTDPVVLLYGLQRSAKHGGDGRFTPDDTLFVRFSRQTIRAFKAAPDSALVDKNDLTPLSWQPVQKQVAVGQVPASAIDLLVEAQLLEMAQAAQLAELAGIEEEEMRKRQAMIWGDYTQQAVSIAALTRAAGFTGVRPSPIAVEPWQPPWSPLYFCWRVSWYPTSLEPQNALDDWSFNGFDYDWKGGSPLDHKQAVTMQGRTLLTKTGTRGLQDNLAALLEQHHGAVSLATLQELTARLKDGLESADLLSQPMMGFNDQLIQRDPLQFYNPDDPEILDLIGDDMVRVAPIPYKNGAPDSHFYPIRAGHFRLQRLWVVDAFGQVFDPIHERGQTPESFTPLRGSGLVTSGPKQRTDTQALQFPPRLVQASRLQFRFIDAETPGESSDAGLVAETNPIAGWLLPNHFDNSITIYNAAGRALGMLMLVGSVKGSELRWDSTPMEKSVAAEGIPNRHMRDFIQGLLNQSHPANAFTELMAVIDSTLWTIDPLGRRKDNLSLLLGRPLALVRASLELQLLDDPASDQLWRNTGQNETKGFTGVPFPIQLGNLDLREDGTLGYFTGDDYTTFNAVQARSLLAVSTYIRNPALNLIIANPQKITLLLDPRGSIHARSGILPTKVIRLPARYVDRPLAEMDVTFRVGPILNEPSGMRMPLPADIRGGWSWIAQTGVDLWTEEEIKLASQQARLSDKPVYLREGWLKLSDALGIGIAESEDADKKENTP